MSQTHDKTAAPGSGLWDTIIKLAPAIASAIAVFGAAFIANSYQSKMSATTLISQREQAESQLRASMFRDLIGAITQTTIGNKAGQKIGMAQEQLLVELLTLNFDGQFEFKPLLLHLDKSLKTELSHDEAKAARESLRSIARRVSTRQIARLMNAGTKGDRTRIDDLIIVNTPQNERQREEFAQRKKQDAKILETYGRLPEYFGQLTENFKLSSPDSRYDLAITVNSCDWDNQSCDVSVDVARNASTREYNAISRKFTLTWFDFPLTDNTLLADGNRFALVFDAVDAESPYKKVALKVIWFPKAYFTPQERPMNYEYMAEKLGFHSGE